VKYHVIKYITVDSEKADYLTLDDKNRRLYGAGRAVIDVDKLIVVGTLPRPVLSVALAPSLNRAITRHGDIIDLQTLTVTTTLPIATRDGSAFDSRTNRALLVGDTAFLVDVRRSKLLTTFSIDSGPQFAVADGNGHIYITLSGANAILDFDARAARVVRTFHTHPCISPTGLAIDQSHRRLFASCDNNTLTAFDADRGDIVSAVQVGSKADAIAFDAGTQLILNPNVDGTMSVIHEDSPNSYSVVDTPSLGGARNSIVLDQATHRAFGYQRTTTGLEIVVLAP
jgi:outer membrane protein assembly factor BamB